jgi:chromosome segregation ATPase
MSSVGPTRGTLAEHGRKHSVERAVNKTTMDLSLNAGVCGTPHKFRTLNNLPTLATLRTPQSNSKAYTSAMLALQERIRQLEKENELSNERNRLLEEQNAKTQGRLMAEAEKRGELEKRTKVLEREVIVTRQQTEELGGAKAYLERLVQQLEKEKERHLEQNSADRETARKEKLELTHHVQRNDTLLQELKEQKDTLQHQLQDTTTRLADLERSLEQSRRESYAETKKLRTENESLTEKLKSMKRRLETEQASLKTVSAS